MRAPVSVIIPCYQASNFLGRAVSSVLNQTLLPQEIIFIDDASPDDGKTKHLIKKLQDKILEKDNGISVISHFLKDNVGPGIARNFAWELSRQPWIAFLDADDAWHPYKLEVSCKWIKSHADVVLVGHLTKVLSNGADIPQLIPPQAIHSERISFGQMLVANRFFTRTVMVRRDIPFRFQDRMITEDYLLWLEVILAGQPAYVLDHLLGFSFRPEFSAGGYSGQLWAHEKKELRMWKYLFRNKKISLSTLFVALPWSYIKYLRRTLKVCLA